MGSFSFISDLFGSKDSPSSFSGIFDSIFAPPSKVLGRESLRPAGAKSQHSPNEPLNTASSFGNTSKGHEGENQNIANRDDSYVYQEQRTQQPCHLSSSIYYGGRDVYPPPRSSQGSGLNSARLGMVTATSGLIPDALAVFESIMAQIHFGFRTIFFTWTQQPAETAAFSSCAASAHGANFIASLSGADFSTFPSCTNISYLQKVL